MIRRMIIRAICFYILIGGVALALLGGGIGLNKIEGLSELGIGGGIATAGLILLIANWNKSTETQMSVDRYRKFCTTMGILLLGAGLTLMWKSQELKINDMEAIFFVIGATTIIVGALFLLASII